MQYPAYASNQHKVAAVRIVLFFVVVVFVLFFDGSVVNRIKNRDKLNKPFNHHHINQLRLININLVYVFLSFDSSYAEKKSAFQQTYKWIIVFQISQWRIFSA